MKQKITLEEGLPPVSVFGIGNKLLEEFCTYFPGLKVVARGNDSTSGFPSSWSFANAK